MKRVIVFKSKYSAWDLDPDILRQLGYSVAAYTDVEISDMWRAVFGIPLISIGDAISLLISESVDTILFPYTKAVDPPELSQFKTLICSVCPHDLHFIYFDELFDDYLNIFFSNAEKKHFPSNNLEYVISEEKKLSYLVNSKVACSSIKASFLDEDIADDYSVHLLVSLKGMRRRGLFEHSKGFFIFTFVRNPFSRLVSCYESKYHIDPVKNPDISDFKYYLWGYLYKDEGFPAFLQKVCSIPYSVMDSHIMRQTDIVFTESGKCRCDFIGHFETLDADFNIIRNRFGLNRLPRLNASGVRNWKAYYTSETASMIYKKYQKDFESFGYYEEM